MGTKTSGTKNKPLDIWAVGRRYAKWIALISLVAVPLNYIITTNEGIIFTSPVGSILASTIIGTFANYLVTLCFVALVTWVSRNEKWPAFLGALIMVGGIVFFFVQNRDGLNQIPTSTPPQLQRETETKIPSPTTSILGTLFVEFDWANCIPGVNMSDTYYESLLLQKTCVYGVITKKDELEQGILYDIHTLEKVITFFILAPDREKLEADFPTAVGVLTNAGVGECIIAVGYPTHAEDVPVFMAVDVRDLRQLSSLLGINNPIIQEISALCK